MTRRAWLLLGFLVLVVGLALALRVGTPRPDRADPASDEVLRSLPYLTWVSTEDSADKRGVTVHDPERAQPGLNLYSPRESHRAFLLDMDGNVLHRWDAAFADTDSWQLVEPLAGGSLLVVVANRRLLEVDRDSRITWRLDRRVHHDVAVDEEGGLYVLAREEREVVRGGRTWPILDDIILYLDAEREMVDRLSIYDLFADAVPPARWAQLAGWLASDAGREEIEATQADNGFRLPNGSPADLFHTNSVEILPEGIEGVAAPGSLLISIRELSTVAIVDFTAKRLDWAWGPGVVRRQHHPSLVDGGRILVFDNLGGTGGMSRVLEVEPTTGEIVWEFNGEPPQAFHTTLRGGAERLANGNTLITESDRGRVFEITRDGETVWEFYNPVTREGGEERSAIYRMTRLEVGYADWLDTGDGNSP